MPDRRREQQRGRASRISARPSPLSSLHLSSQAHSPSSSAAPDLRCIRDLRRASGALHCSDAPMLVRIFADNGPVTVQHVTSFEKRPGPPCLGWRRARPTGPRLASPCALCQSCIPARARGRERATNPQRVPILTIVLSASIRSRTVPASRIVGSAWPEPDRHPGRPASMLRQ